MKTAKRIQLLVEQLKEEGLNDVADVVEKSLKECPELENEEYSAERFLEDMSYFFNTVVPEGAKQGCLQDSERTVDEEIMKASLVYQARLAASKLQVVGSQVVIAASVISIILN